MHSADSARRGGGSRRRPELNINTTSSTTSSSTPPVSALNMNGGSASVRPSTRGDASAVVPSTPPNSHPNSSSTSNRRPPVSSKGKQAAANSRALSSKLPTTYTYPPTRDAARQMQNFLDSITPGVVDMSNKENDRPEPTRPNPRDSHDLSLSPRNVTRDSLVANMLLSLDQFSMGQMNDQFAGSGTMTTSYDDSNPYSYGNNDAGSRSMTASSRARGINGHGYTYSSDYEGADDSSRISSQPSRGRRSNSSSGFQSSLGRINSMRESSTHQRSVPGTPRPLHSRGGKGSKSSSTNSIDAGGYAQVLSSQRWAQGFGGRSSSFDYGHRQSTSNPPSQYQPSQQQQQQQPWHIEFSNSFFNEDYDAAPTPTVPGGPRRLQTAPSMPSFPPPQPMVEPKSPMKSSNPERKRSTRSSRSATVGRQAQSKFNTTRDIPPMPAIDLDSAPAPHVGYEKSKEVLAGGIPASASQVKEKQGFFRRVFGSSKNSLVAALDSSMNSHSNSSFASSASAGNSQQNITSPVKSSAPPSRESHHSTHVLQKKPSSFFRRRKKSVVEQEPPPPPVPTVRAPVDFPVETALPPAKPEPSPVTSLRKAMSPFLKGSPVTPNAFVPSGDPSPEEDILEDPLSREVEREVDVDLDDEIDERRVRGFSPDYEPDPKATIRSVQPESRGRDTASSSGEAKRAVETPSRQAPEPPKKQQPQQPSRSGSFLHDNSESEDSPKRVVKQPSRSSVRGSRERSPSVALRSRSSGLLSPNMDKPLPSPSTIRDDATSKASEKILLQNPDQEKDPRPTSLTLPIEGAVSDANGSLGTAYKSSTSLGSAKVESRAGSEDPRDVKSDKPIDEPEFVIGDPTEDDRAKAQKIFDGNEDFIQKEKAAAWMGEEGPLRQRTLRAYMELYDFTDKSVLNALRQVCGRLVFRAETQQVDRILVAFSKRWCDCNPNHGFKSMDVIHTICYSIMLLNTDLHLADIESKMTRSQFIKNTMTTVRQAVADSVPDAFERASILPGKNQNLGVDGEGRTSVDQDRTLSFRASFKPPPRSESRNGMASDGSDDCGPLVKAPFEGTLKAWESQMEIVLKETYASIRDDRLPLYGAEATPLQSQNSLSVMGMLKRTPSVLSKAPSENSSRGRVPENAKANNNRWTSKSRSRPRAFGGTGFSSSRTSFDDGNSVWSPAESSATWSRASLGRTHTSMSMDSFGSAWPRGDFQQSIGFANALSQAIIRDDALGSSQSLVSDELKNTQLLDDESLELAGPPWVKEGIVTHKHHLDGIDKKAKDRNWTEVFAVIQKGQLSIFSFSSNKSLGRSKGRSARNAQPVQKGAVVGGGNWQDNATNLGTFSLRQTLASALPPPGYSRQRPNVWALSLPTGAVHLFQVGTPEISKEFVTTANYWSARLSTHPLVGGISNIEYGWSEAIVNNSLVSAINESTSSGPPGNRGGSRPGSSAAGAIGSSSINNGRTSMHSRGSSFRSVGSFDFGSSGQTGSSGRGKLPGDKVHIAEWTPPTQSMRPSNAPEKEQLQTLLAYVRSIEDELQQHNALRSPMLLAFTPRGHNAAKAMANWERKSSYLLREIVKFRTYVDCLQQAETRKAEIWQEREIARRAARGEAGESFEIDRNDTEGANVEEDDDDADETLRP